MPLIVPPTTPFTKADEHAFAASDTVSCIYNKSFAGPASSPTRVVVLARKNAEAISLCGCDLRNSHIDVVDASLFIGGSCVMDCTTSIRAACGVEVAPGLDLNGADLDYSSLQLCCSNVRLKDSSDRLFYQLLYHAMSMDCPAAKALRRLSSIHKACARFHRFGECQRRHPEITWGKRK